MNKIWLIIKREYLTRVRNKTFLISVIVTPLLIFGIMTTAIYLSTRNKDEVKLVVKDDSGIFRNVLKSTPASSIQYTFDDEHSLAWLSDSLRYKKLGYTGILHIPAFNVDSMVGVNYISGKQLGLMSRERVQGKLRDAIELKRLEKEGIDTARLKAAKTKVLSLQEQVLDKDGKLEKHRASSTASYIIGYASSFLMYLLVLLFGTAIMQGVMEEKTNRIAEVMVSSVKPFQLMMGKIIGIAAVGLTGFIIWIVLLMILYTIGLSFLSVDTLQQAQNITQQMPQATSASGFQQAMGSISEVIKGLNLPLLIFCFIFYFLGGFLFYASLFAAIGSVVNESPQEAQSLAMPITLPIIFSMVIMFSVISAPSGPLATWASIIPFSSPIVMMARIPFGVPGTVPWWELIASMLSLIAGFLFTTWMAARIYRVGILMYGKKATWKEMMRWAFRKN